LDLGVAPRENITSVFGETQRQSAFSGVSSRYPRTKADAIISLEIASEDNWLHKLFPGLGTGVSVNGILPHFGHHIAEAIDQSELRKWEKRNGYNDRTNCVQLTYTIKIRIGYEDGIATLLYSHETPPLVYNY
jgi:hypothetical protein